MSILVYDLLVDDLEIYAPAITDAMKASATLQARIMQAQMLAEGWFGANRPLEETTITQEVRAQMALREDLSQSGRRGPLQSVYLKVTPIASITTVQARAFGQIKDSWGREIPATQWATIDSTGYDYESRRGLLILKTASLYNELRVTYVGGYDFDEVDSDTTIETEKKEIRYAVGAILESLMGATAEASSLGGTGKRIKSVKQTGIDYEYDKLKNSNIPPAAMQLLQKFRPLPI